MLIVTWFGFFDTERKLMLTSDFSTYMDREFIKTMKTLGSFMLEIFDVAMKASRFKWTDESIALFSAIILMNPSKFEEYINCFTRLIDFRTNGFM